jgi:8-oxo-dGTP diphosphatase
MTDLPRHVVVVLVFIRQDDRILLVRQDYGSGYWSLPGGSMEHGESIDEAAVREVKEETSLDVRIMRVVGLYAKPKEEAIAITLEAEVTGGTLQADNEIDECCFFPVDQLPQPIREHLRERVADFCRELPSAVMRTQ